jgi:hypothetical protein
MSDSESEGEDIKLGSNVFNITYYDSSEDETASSEEISSDEESNSDSEDDEIDETTEKKLKVLTDRLEEVADVVAISRTTFKVIFYEKKGIVLQTEGECDFDIDKKGLPMMVDGGENFLIPYLEALCKKKKFLKPFTIKTNCSKEKFYF